MKSNDRGLAGRILWGLLFGLLAGLAALALGSVWPGVSEGARWISTQLFDPLGQIFLRLLFFVIVPLVFSSLASGVAQLGRPGLLGPLAGKTFLLFLANMAIGVGIGLVMMNVLKPGEGLSQESVAKLLQDHGNAAGKHVAAIQAGALSTNFDAIVEMFMPRNLLGAITGTQRNALGEVLPLILFAILTGASAMKLREDQRTRLLGALDMVSTLMTSIVDMALKLAPYAVPAMIFSVIVKIGPGIIVTLGLFVLGCMTALFLHLCVTMSLWLRFLAKRSPLTFFKEIRAVMVTAFSTSSSNATLPAALECAIRELKVKPSVAGFVLPLGTTMNMSGTALFEGCVVLFVAQVYGVHLELGQQVTLLLLSVLSAVAVAGIPGGSLPLIAGLLAGFGIPPEGIGLVLGVDRLLDMSRTLVNVSADMVTTVVVDKWTSDPKDSARLQS